MTILLTSLYVKRTDTRLSGLSPIKHIFNKKKFSRVHKWIKVGQASRQEMYAFIGLITNMGLVRKSTLESYWDLIHKCQATP